MPLQAIWKYDIPARDLVQSELSFEKLAKLCSLHEAVSPKLVDDPQAMMGLGTMFDEACQGFAHVKSAHFCATYNANQC